ncbi:hypothetical protein WA1_51685 [Scytonema hofmannii PCC 7110]|uniref:Uncharacterized protein n=1 Tax=Scytonema hofmannii PCC 7110 TaxID=128403 RepID=A0A139WPW6_9CYAN|nr:hypothetical protein WA1_51685 [Scytonema hofmannii PCC 7110]
MRGPAAFLTPFEAERLADVAGEVGLHLAKLVLAADQLAGIQLTAGIEGDHQDLHVRGGLVAVHHGRQDVLGTMAVLEPVQGAAEVIVLLVPAHGMNLLGRSADEVLQGMDGVLADLLGGAGVPGFHDALGGAGTLEHQVLGHAGLIGVRGVAFAVVVTKGCAQMSLGLDLAHAEDGEAPGRARSAADLHALAEVCHHIRHVAPPFEKNVHSLDNLSCVQIIPFAPAGGSAHFSQMDQPSRPGQEKPPVAA